MAVLARQHELYPADLAEDPPYPGLAPDVPLSFWLEHRVISWRRLGNALVLAAARPNRLARVHDAWPGQAPEPIQVIAEEAAILDALAKLHHGTLAEAVGQRVDAAFSCRTWGWRPLRNQPVLAGLILLTVCPIVRWSSESFAALSMLAIMSLLCTVSFKIAGGLCCLSGLERSWCHENARAAGFKGPRAQSLDAGAALLRTGNRR